MTELEVVPPHAIVRHQQPSAARLLHRVQRHARGRWHHEHQQALRVALNTLVQGTAPVKLPFEDRDRQEFGISVGPLHHRLAAEAEVAM